MALEELEEVSVMTSRYAVHADAFDCRDACES